MSVRAIAPIIVLVLCACAPRTAPLPAAVHLLHEHVGLLDSGQVNVVVEIPSGTNDKWQVNKSDGALEWEQRDGRPRVVQYLSYPGNYGMIPQTLLPAALGGDNDPLDVLLLGPARTRGAVVPARVIGALRLLDGGERDDKLIAVGTEGPLSDVRSLADLDARYRGVREIVALWFANYKGPNVVTLDGFVPADSAMAIVREASRQYRNRLPTDWSSRTHTGAGTVRR